MAIHKRKIRGAVIALFLLLAAGAVFAAPVGTFTRVEGGVDILRVGEAAAGAVKAGDPVSMGDAIRTKRNGKVEIQFQDETVIQLAPETRLTIDEYSFRPGGARNRGFLSLLRGKVRAMVSKLKGTAVAAGATDAGFSVKTPTAIAGVRGTDFVVYYERGVSGIVFLEGVGFAYNPARPDAVVIIKGGQAAFVPSATAAPTNAQTVTSTFVAPHLKDTTVALTSSEGDGGAEGPGGIQVNVTSANTSYEALTNLLGAGGGVPTSTVGGPIVVLDIGNQGAATTAIPVTETHPSLLASPVTVHVPLP